MAATGLCGALPAPILLLRKGWRSVFFVWPMFSIVTIYILAAVVPAFFLMRYIYRMDTIEKEPPMLLLSLALYGVLAAVLAGVLEGVAERILASQINPDSEKYTIILAFLVVAVIEEGLKFLFLKYRTWRDPNFDYRFDGIVYAVFVSLGFAAWENLQYVMGYGLSVAVPRALLALPGHMGFAVFMGAFYGKAKLCEDIGHTRAKHVNLVTGYIVAVLLHGFYDSCAMIGDTLSTVLFIVFVVAMYFIVIRLIRKESAQNTPV